jgi:molecular chaperone GrpE
MKEQLARFREERDDLVGSLQRLQADFENFRKRNARERAEDFARATALVLESLLPVLDAFERAFASEMDPSQNDVRRGFELIHKQLVDVLTQHGLSRIEALGQPFDPHLHQAVERLETSEVPEGTIVEELRSGYKVRDRVVRPAMVRVAVAPAGVAAGDSPKVN